jgi:conjugal transfer ATP-binding protein TraC
VDLAKRLVVFEVRDLPEELRPGATFLIADFVWSMVRRERKPRRLVIDEAWTLAQTEVGGRFLASLARRARKYFLGLTTITQDVGDFLGSEQGRAVLQNSALKLLLRQDASALDRLGLNLKLTAAERDLLGRFGKGQGLLCAPDSRVAVEITAAPEEYRLITSDPRDLARLAQAHAAEDDTSLARGLPAGRSGPEGSVRTRAGTRGELVP